MTEHAYWRVTVCALSTPIPTIPHTYTPIHFLPLKPFTSTIPHTYSTDTPDQPACACWCVDGTIFSRYIR